MRKLGKGRWSLDGALLALEWAAAIALVAIIAVVTTIHLFSGPISNRILANALSLEDGEIPPTVTSYSIGSENIQIIGGLGQGLNCSLWKALDNIAFGRKENTSSISLRMRQACVFHDYCYRHGAATYGYTQADCDYALQEQAFRLCTRISGTQKSLASCETEARKLTLGVRIGGSDSFRRANNAPDKDASVYFEFDPYPRRTDQFLSVRVADAPRHWIAAGAAAKAFYGFRIRPSGVQLRIIGLDLRTGRRLCAAYALNADYRYMSGLPVMTATSAPVEDWFVWMRRESTTNTSSAFSGLAPGRATLADWSKVFGTARDITSSALCVGLRSPAPTSDSDAAPASFADLPAVSKRTGATRSAALSEIHPLSPKAGAPASNVIELYGLSPHQCANDAKDKSTCIVQISINPYDPTPKALRDPFNALERDCYGAVRAKTCDSYRNFAVTPYVAYAGDRIGVAWLRRGNAAGENYSEDAILRWARAANPSLDQKWQNYQEVKIKGLEERYEPLAWTKPDAAGMPALLSIVESPECGGAIKVLRFPIEPRLEGDSKTSKQEFCITNLDAAWLKRPWRLLAGERILLVHQTIEGSEPQQRPESWKPKVVLKVAFVDAASGGAREAAVETVGIVQTFSVCKVDESGTPWRIRTADCNGRPNIVLDTGRAPENDPRGIDLKDAQRTIFGVVNRMPLMVASVDDEGQPELAYFLQNYADIVFFKRNGAEKEGTWTRLDNPP